MNTKILIGDNSSIKKAASLISSGEVVAFPTETVYGLGASLFCEEAVSKIFSLKGRLFTKPLLIHVSSLDQINEIVEDPPDEFFLIAKLFFPGPLSIVLKKKERISSVVSAGQDTIGIRMPDHPLALRLIDEVGHPIVGTSANFSGSASHVEAPQVFKDFSGKIPAIIDGGKCREGVASTVLSLCDPKKPVLLRLGNITKEQLEEVLDRKIQSFIANTRI